MVSPGHLVYASNRPAALPSDFTARPASTLRPGDYVWSRAGLGSFKFAPARVESVVLVRGVGKIAPFTLDGSLVVDGMLASSYATHGLVSAEASHAILAPLRWLWRLFPAALHALHRGEAGSRTLLAAGLGVLDTVQKIQGLLAALWF
jgi:hypothetical protein